MLDVAFYQLVYVTEAVPIDTYVVQYSMYVCALLVAVEYITYVAVQGSEIVLYGRLCLPVAWSTVRVHEVYDIHLSNRSKLSYTSRSTSQS